MMDHSFRDGGQVEAREILLPRFAAGFEVSWAGQDPFGRRYCFGSEDGRILFLDPKMPELFGPFDAASSKEAVNGVAFGESSIAVSTRQDLVCIHLIEGVEHVARLHQGAHGVCASKRGDYYAPVGRQGLFKLEPRPEGLSVHVLSRAGQDMNAYFYRIACLSSPDRGEALACALRQGGFAVLPLGVPSRQNGPRLLRTGTDIVDVCPLGTDDSPLAAAALGTDCSIHLARDPFTDNRIKTLRLDVIQDRAYRILCAEGHVFLLARKGLYMIMDQARGFLDGATPDKFQAEVHFLEMEAVDINLASDRRLLVLMPEHVLELEIESLVNRQGGTPLPHASVQSRLLGTEETWKDLPDSWQWSRADQGMDPIGRWESSGQSLLCAL